MRTFTLRAHWGNGNYKTHLFGAENDRDAVATGAMVVMQLAYPNREPWASGHIQLINDMGVILQEMQAK
jgi:hypothetical protein